MTKETQSAIDTLNALKKYFNTSLMDLVIDKIIDHFHTLEATIEILENGNP